MEIVHLSHPILHHIRGFGHVTDAGEWGTTEWCGEGWSEVRGESDPLYLAKLQEVHVKTENIILKII